VGARKRAMAEGAMDSLREKFGQKAVETGYTFGKGRKADPPESIDRDEE
jgi:DNA polymerase-4